MLLSGVLFVLFLAGCWLYCLTDAALTPAEEFPGWRKRTWLVVIAVTLIAGAIAWLIARRNRRPEDQWPSSATHLIVIDRDNPNVVWVSPWTAQAEADAAARDRDRHRHPAGRSMPAELPADWVRPLGPDDDPEFLRELSERIHGTPTDPAAE
jgi:hypothetical protein